MHLSAVSTLARKIEAFFTLYLKKGDRVLLGFSGGNDSLTLLHVVLQLPFEVHLAHFDHGWRSTSKEEALQLEKFAEGLNIPFFTERASLESISGKLSEERARSDRFAFFKRLYREGNYQALLLAHHRDDQAETILKRLFEGAHLASLGGMKEAQIMDEMLILRPLLKISKEELSQCNLIGIQDETNNDQRFLRGRMRSSLFPELSRLFGKEIKSSLIRLGHYAEELKELLGKKSYSIVSGPFGLMIDGLPVERALLRYALHEILQAEGLCFRESLLSSLMQQLIDKKTNCRIHPRVYVDRGIVFILKCPFLAIKWRADWMQVTELQPGGWRQLWQGKVLLSVPSSARYQLVRPSLRSPSIDKRWTAHRVPAFLRHFLPLLSNGEHVIGEFLSGQKPIMKCKFCISMEIVSVQEAGCQSFEVIDDKIFLRD